MYCPELKPEIDFWDQKPRKRVLATWASWAIASQTSSSITQRIPPAALA